MAHSPFFVMAGLDPATQWPRVGAAETLSTNRHNVIDDAVTFPARTDVRALGGRVKPGHDDRGVWKPNNKLNVRSQ